MKFKSILKAFMLSAALFSAMSLTDSCKKEEGPSDNTVYGTISGTVKDDLGNLLEGVAVTVKDVEGTAMTAADGTYSFTKVPVARQAVTFSKDGYATVNATIQAKDFNDENVAVYDAVLYVATAKITGKVLDAYNDNAPLAGATVKVSDSKSVQTGEDGTFSLENLRVMDYTVTISKATYTDVVKEVVKTNFNEDGVVDLGEIIMGGSEILPGLTVNDLNNAEAWYYNEYRGGRDPQPVYPHYDWTSDYLCTFNFVGNWDENNEGTKIEVKLEDANDAENFNAYVWGKKKITDDNKILTVMACVFGEGGNDDVTATIGVQVVDMSSAEPAAVLVGNSTLSCANDQHPFSDHKFDLSAYVGKEVIIAVGLYKDEDIMKRVMLRRLAFGPSETAQNDWLGGTEVSGLAGWHMTEEIVRSTMPISTRSFTGASDPNPNRDTYKEPYITMKENHHIATEWSLVQIKKDAEYSEQGFMIKCANGEPANLDLPHNYIYTKIAVDANSDHFVLKTRNFHSSQNTWFKLVAIPEDTMQPEYIRFTSSTAQSYSFDEASGAVKFINEKGDYNTPDDYATFEFDLSKYSGKNVVLCLGVFRAEENDSENGKFVLYSIDLN